MKTQKNVIKIKNVSQQNQKNLMLMSCPVQNQVYCNENIQEIVLEQLISERDGQLVYLARNTQKINEQYVLKQYKKSYIKKQKMISQIQNEVDILYKLNHKNITKLYIHFEDQDYVYLLKEFVEQSEQIGLEKLYNQRQELQQQNLEKESLQEEKLKNFVSQLLDALDYTHRQKIIHRNLNLKNILIDKNNIVKIGGFGFANYYPQGKIRRLSIYDSKDPFLAPEQIQGIPQTDKVDTWRLGLIILEIINMGQNKDNKKNLEGQLSQKQVEYPENLSILGKDFLFRCLQRNHKERLSIYDLKQHQWVSQFFQEENKAGDQQKPKQNSMKSDAQNLKKSVTVEYEKTLQQKSKDKLRDRILKFCEDQQLISEYEQIEKQIKTVINDETIKEEYEGEIEIKKFGSQEQEPDVQQQQQEQKQFLQENDDMDLQENWEDYQENCLNLKLSVQVEKQETKQFLEQFKQKNLSLKQAVQSKKSMKLNKYNYLKQKLEEQQGINTKLRDFFFKYKNFNENFYEIGENCGKFAPETLNFPQKNDNCFNEIGAYKYQDVRKIFEKSNRKMQERIKQAEDYQQDIQMKKREIYFQKSEIQELMKQFREDEVEKNIQEEMKDQIQNLNIQKKDFLTKETEFIGVKRYIRGNKKDSGHFKLQQLSC
ncbi:Protein kinase-like domain [Pseudocohnilembus persalinus]|uniref:Protein kinase-like domain n=1 Tax=Pseudocohnilembus persalinus TaxID=266149 RepID=A0A0V0R723_PSEPJ|nr:Protein kinase-like domain [Pseudocohnilembus persalinus]|eukprot:KRX10310.1 Protein kinase-like domain [Pseudocohnilembus persalinus]